MFVIRCDFVITYQHSGHYYQKQLTDYREIKIPLLGFLSPPFYFTHDASCVVLDIEWTPL